MELVVQWLGRHAEDWTDDEVIAEVRDIVLDQIQAFAPNAGASAHQWEQSMQQVGSALDVTLARFMGQPAQTSSQREFAEELTEGLYNEISFLRLMQNIDEFVSDAAAANSTYID